VRIAYYPEDVEKMASMSLDERIDYCTQLKLKGRYTVVDEEPEEPDELPKPVKKGIFDRLLKRFFGM